MTRQMERYRLARDITAVAVEGAWKWAAYIGNGDNMEAIANDGQKLTEEVARSMFPDEPWKSGEYRH